MRLIESIVEDAALSWLGELSYGVEHAPNLAPGEIVSERGSFSDVLLASRLRDAIARLNPSIANERTGINENI